MEVNYCVVVSSSILEVLAIIVTGGCAFALMAFPDGVKYVWLTLGIVFVVEILTLYICCYYKARKKVVVIHHVVLILLAAVKDIMLIVSLATIPNESCGEDVVEDLLLAVKITGGVAVLVSLFHHLKFHFKDPYYEHILIYGAHLLPQLLSLTVLIYSLAHPCNVKATSCSTD